MLGVAIVGGGLSGLGLARALQARKISFGLFEARSRLGGRVLCVPAAADRVRFDVGPTWYWPQSHPALTRLIAELGLESFEQQAAPGYLEGALDAASRAERAVGTAPAHLTREGATPAAELMDAAPTSSGAISLTEAGGLVNTASLSRFSDWVRAQQDIAFDSYRQHINVSLAAQQREQLTQRAVLRSMESIFDAALEQLRSLPLDMRSVSVERGCTALTPRVQAAFQGFIDRLLEEVARFNRTSCALSNFPDEHHIPKDYEQALLRDLAAAWREFSVAANGILLAKMTGVSAMPARVSPPSRALSP